jgi:hypothetical protein
MRSAAGAGAAAPAEDPALHLIRVGFAPSPERWVGALRYTGLAVVGVLATVTFRIPYSVLIFAGILLLITPPAHRPFHQAVQTTGVAFLGAGLAILLSITAYDQPWVYLPLQCALLTVLLVLSRITAARAAFVLAAGVLSFAEPAYLPDPQDAIYAALSNALAVAGTAWVVAATQSWFAQPTTPAPAPTPPGPRALVGFAMLALTAIGLQMLFYDTINLPEIRTGVIAAILTADPDLREVWRRMPVRELGATGCAALALLMTAIGAPVMDDLGWLVAVAGCCYFAVGWIAHGRPPISFAGVTSTITVTVVLLPASRFIVDIVPTLLLVAGALWGKFFTALVALLLAPLVERGAERQP